MGQGEKVLVSAAEGQGGIHYFDFVGAGTTDSMLRFAIPDDADQRYHDDNDDELESANMFELAWMLETAHGI